MVIVSIDYLVVIVVAFILGGIIVQLLFKIFGRKK